jgi:ABC-2 type transport system permease protein
LLFYFEILLILPVLSNPSSPLAIGLSLFPLTAATFLPMRIALSEVPLWQIVFSLIILYASGAGSLWLGGRAFRLGLLRYGKGVRLLEFFKRG